MEKTSSAISREIDVLVERIIEKVDADPGHTIVTERLNVRDTAKEFAFERRQRFDFFGNFQAKLKLGAFPEFEACRKVGAPIGDIHGLDRK